MWKKTLKLIARRKRKRRTNNLSIHNSSGQRKIEALIAKQKRESFGLSSRMIFALAIIMHSSLQSRLVHGFNHWPEKPTRVWFEWLDIPHFMGWFLSPSLCLSFSCFCLECLDFLPFWWAITCFICNQIHLCTMTASNWIDSVKCRIAMYIRAHSLTIDHHVAVNPFRLHYCKRSQRRFMLFGN